MVVDDDDWEKIRPDPDLIRRIRLESKFLEEEAKTISEALVEKSKEALALAKAASELLAEAKAIDDDNDKLRAREHREGSLRDDRND